MVPVVVLVDHCCPGQSKSGNPVVPRVCSKRGDEATHQESLHSLALLIKIMGAVARGSLFLLTRALSDDVIAFAGNQRVDWELRRHLACSLCFGLRHLQRYDYARRILQCRLCSACVQYSITAGVVDISSGSSSCCWCSGQHCVQQSVAKL